MDKRVRKVRLLGDDVSIESLEMHVADALSDAVCEYEDKIAEAENYRQRVSDSLDVVEQIHTEDAL